LAGHPLPGLLLFPNLPEKTFLFTRFPTPLASSW